MRKFMMIGAAAAALVGFASQANAATVIINSSSLYSTAYTVHIGGTIDGNPPLYPDVYESPELMNITIGSETGNIIAFCVDLFHLWSGSDAPATYTTDPVTHNSDSGNSGGGPGLPHQVSAEIGYLAKIGQGVSDAERLAGIQGAIWAIEYPNITLTGANSSSYLNHYITLANTWGANHPNASVANGIYPLNGQTQGFGFTQGFTTGVPEPATWTLMIGGFGLAGAALRRRRAATAA
jgi:hypothetical protein